METETTYESNETKVDNPVYFVQSTEELNGLFIEMGVFLIIGLPGNALLILALLRKIRTRSSKLPVYNYTILAIAIGDFLVLGLYLPAFVVQKIPAIFDSSGCHIFEFCGILLEWYINGIVYIVIPIERYFAICRPMYHFGKRHIQMIGTVTLLISIVYAGLSTPSVTTFDSTGNLIGCHYADTSLYNRTIHWVFLPTAVTYVVIALTLHGIVFYYVAKYRKATQMSDSVRPVDICAANAVQAGARVAFMLFGVMILDTLCWIPFHLEDTNIIKSDQRYLILVYLKNVLNFALFGLMNKNIRTAMWDVLRCKTSINHTPNNSSKTVDMKSEPTMV